MYFTSNWFYNITRKIMITNFKIKTFCLLFFSMFLSCNKTEVASGQSNIGPVISYLLPNRGYVGQNMTIVGEGFGDKTDALRVFFGNRELPVTSAMNRAITAEVPEFNGDTEIQLYVEVGDKTTNTSRFIYKEREDAVPPPVGTRVTNSGHLVASHTTEVRKLRGSGPFVRLPDRAIFTVAEGSTVASISRDEGVTWTNYPILPSESYSLLSPYCTVTPNGTIILGFSNGKEIKRLNWNRTTHTYDPEATLPTYTICSLDGGRTWQDLTKLHDEWTGMNRDMITLKNGDVVFATMKMFNNPGRHTVLTYTSKDNGVTWQASNVLEQPGAPSGDHAGFMESTLEELSDGRLYMLIRTNLDYMYDTYSDDSGLTWSIPQITDIDASSSPGVLKRLKSGRLIFVWNKLYPEGRTDFHRMPGDGNLAEVEASWHRDELSVMFSEDDGQTWSDPTVIAKNHLHAPSTAENAWDQTKWLSYPHLFEVKPGVLWLTTGHGGLKIEFEENRYIQ